MSRRRFGRASRGLALKVELEDAAAHVFRRSLEADRVDDALRDVWRVLESGDAAGAGALEGVERLHALVGAATLTRPEACGLAVVTPDGRLRHTDARFARWLGDPHASPACRRLIRESSTSGRTVGLVETPGGGVLAVCAVQGAVARRWSIGSEAGVAALAQPGSVLLLAFAPSRSGDLVMGAAKALNLSALETRLVEALLEAPTLEAASDAIGVGRETAKDALGRAMRKAGVSRASQLLGRIIDLSCGAGGQAVGHDGQGDDALGGALGLSSSEARVAQALADGATANEAASALGFRPETVKSYRKAVFAKTGVNRARDLRRLVSEAQELSHIAKVAEVSFDLPEPRDQLRLVVGTQGRRIAFVDHGPTHGEVVLVGHGLATGRRVPPPLTLALQAAGYRPIALQRPGFGLTDPARGGYLDDAVEDTLRVVDSLGAERAVILAREGGCAAALAFGERRPDRLKRGLLLNPRSPLHAAVSGATFGDRLSRALMLQPAVIAPFAEVARRHTRSDLLRAMLKRVYADVPIDRELVAQPEMMAHLVRDVQGLMSRTTVGVVDEHRVYAEGWRIPDAVRAADWSFAYSTTVWTDDDLAVWRDVPGLRMAPLHGAALLAQFTHADALTGLLR